MSPVKRHEARRLALIAQTAREYTSYGAGETFQLMAHLKEDWADLPDFTRQLCYSLEQNERDIESQVSRVLENWKLHRLGMVERAILKLAATEITRFSDIPPRVTINEYIELSKRYADEHAPPLINGVLDRLVELAAKPDVQIPKRRT
jgi:transcription antitermination protein NusB